ncbi:hypothetical protein CERZMDRAFT_99883 [Cercospora zeae-maydis SCOH1-5]|uniref:Cytochrome P450 n=1 Tax=Cercospora zeae-maydis SCOH1-5 TaxID=717836 RepID=A0A6A6F8V4_9PEZI|nr:hypothetical protein CERZMDRAFT_99883 [Cercospora zeae-maydis SCOH1-5]
MAMAAALITHIGVQKHEPTALQAVCAGVLANIGLFTRLAITGARSLTSLLKLLAYVDVVYILSLTVSIIVYRIFLHPLRSFPGPVGASVSKFWTVRIHLDGEYHRKLRELHKQYDDFVRVGPRELDINNVEAIPAIYGHTSKCRKGPCVSAVNEFEDYLLHHVNGFLDRLHMSKGKEDISWLFTHFSFDIMGELAFGRSFDMIQSGHAHQFMITLHKFMHSLSLLSAIPWMTSLLRLLPVSAEIKMFQDFAEDCVQERVANSSPRRDLFHFLLGEDKETGSKLTRAQLVQESRTAIAGGSDTSSITLGCLFYYLVRHQDKYRILQAEIAQHAGRAPENGWLGALPYLNACINEALRLMPPVPQGLQRQTPPAGLQIGDHWIPGNTLVGVSPFVIQRDARYFSNPDAFVPERWLDDAPPESFVKQAWIPFTIGTYSCVGKQFALSELRHVTFAVVRDFDMEFAEGFDADQFEFSVKNDFVLTPPSVMVNIRSRRQSN